MLASSDKAAEGQLETDATSSGGRGLARKALKAPAIMITIAAAGLLIMSQGAELGWHWSAQEIGPLAGTLLLAVGAVLLANYLSTGRRSRGSHREGLGYDRNPRLDL